VKEMHMKPHCSNDDVTIREIETIKSTMRNIISLADEQSKSNKLNEAKQLYEETQHLSYYVGTGLICKIMNEHHDIENWNI
jgi:hypothetical protein